MSLRCIQFLYLLYIDYCIGMQENNARKTRIKSIDPYAYKEYNIRVGEKNT